MSSVQLHPAWKQALVKWRAEGFAYGDTVSDEWLSEALGVPMVEPDMPAATAQKLELKLLDQFTALSEYLLTEMQMALRRVKRGYQVLQPKDQSAWAEAECRKVVARELRKAQRRLINVNATMLNAEDRTRNADALARNGQMLLASRQVWGRRFVREERQQGLPLPDAKSA